MTVRYFRASLEPVGPRGFKAIAASAGLKGDGIDLVMSGANLSRAQSGNMPLLLQHNPESLVGKVTSARVAGNNLIIAGEFPPEGASARADEACALLKSGFLNNLSAGFSVERAEPIDPKASWGPVRATKWTLLEASLVAVPLDTEAVVTARAGKVLSGNNADKLRQAHYAAERCMRHIGDVLDGAGEGAGADGDDEERSADYRRRQAEKLELIGDAYGDPHSADYRRRQADRLGLQGRAP